MGIDWRYDKPPLSTWIVGLYDREIGRSHVVKTCRRGCCVHGFLGCMVMPLAWRFATDEEAAEEIAERAKLEDFDPFDTPQGAGGGE